MRATVVKSIAALGILLWGSTAHAQSAVGQRVSVEFAGAVNTSTNDFDEPFVFLDLTATGRITDDLDIVIRPYARRLPGGDWSKEMYQLQVRYQPSTRVPIRIDAGIIASPLGIIALEMRPDRNPVIGNPTYYFTPLPSFDGRQDRVQLLSSGYPLGAMASFSGARWDARAGVTDGTPARNRKMMWADRPPARAQFVMGGGVTPITGLRLGFGYAHGVYREPGISAPQAPAAHATIFNVEGEYAVGHTRLAGEWVRDSFGTMTTPAVSSGYTVEAVQTLSPRWYAASRNTRTSAPAFVHGTRVQRSNGSTEAIVGFRVNTLITLKAGYQGSRAYTAQQWDHAAAVSIVLFKRWW
jgi:hypothetical protein